MNHKEALQKIADFFKPVPKDIIEDELIDMLEEIGDIAFEALQSESEEGKTDKGWVALFSSEEEWVKYLQWRKESRMYSEEEVIGFGIWLGEKHWFNLSTYKWECINEEGLYKVLDSKQLMELYRQSLQPKTEELKEGLKPCPNHPNVLISQCGICNGTFPKLEQPKTEEVIDQYVVLNQDGMTFDKLSPYAKESDEPKEQPTSPSIEKIAEEWFEKQGKNIFTNYDTRPAFIEGYKANNSLDELEKWLIDLELTDKNDTIDVPQLLSKIQQLKNK
jgi:hypothetical protein